ncbi:LysR substrate-binding domain-containing protein [Anaerobium acetethylicum]|nr:LysR substrate-binding domain-containing protein [Anaerobium acetethylicum]
MQQTIRALTDSNHIRIRLATAPNRGAIIYSRIYNEFSRRYPNVSLSLTELYASEQAGAIARGQIDIAIGSGTSSDKITDIPIAYEELLVSLPISHPLSNVEQIRLADLSDTPFVLQGKNHSIRILAEELFKEAGFNPVIAFESNDVILIDSMLHQAVGAGLVSHAHVFPCRELAYRPLDPPVNQTLHIRYPLGHTLTEPERYLAGLLIRERLSDSRYSAIPSSEVTDLLNCVNADSDSTSIANSPASDGTTITPPHVAPEINLNTQLLQYIIAIVDEKSLTRAAEKFYLTQPMLSRYLRNVESKLCTQLFTRVHNRLMPTNAGKVFVNSSRNILQFVMDMETHLHSYRIGHGGGIYLQCDFGLAKYIEEQIKRQFHDLFPDVKLFVSETSRHDIEESLQNASADFGLYFSCSPKHPVLECQIIAKSELVYCNPTQASMTKAQDAILLNRSISPGQVMLCQKGSSLREEQVRIFTDLYESPAEITCEANISILLHLAAEGIADSVLPVDQLSSEAAKRSIPFKQPQEYHLMLSHHPSRALPPSAKKLAQLLNKNLQTYFIKGK